MFDLTGVTADERNFEPLPDGNYVVVAQEAQVKETKARTGKYIGLKFSISEPSEYSKRFLFANLNVQNANPKAQEIGLKQLRGLMDAVGIKGDKLTDVNQLVGIPLSVYVNSKERDGKMENKICSFDPLAPNQMKAPSVNTKDAFPNF